VSAEAKSGRKLALALIGAAMAGAGVVLATNEGFRDQVIASAKALGEEIAGQGPS
jgi:sulfite exporter TauE/SafE